MGTRGVIGFYREGKTKVSYSQFDSYPSEMGKNILEEIRYKKIEELNKAFDFIKVVGEKTKPTIEEINECIKKGGLNINVSTQSVEDWYNLLREFQGTLKPYLDSIIPYMDNYESFLGDGLFCEWGYIINLDKNVLEVWKGFEKGITKNRYEIKKLPDNGYGNCVLIKEYPLNDLPTEEKFIEELEKDEED